MTTPAGQSMAKASESGMEWLTWIGSTVKQPSVTFWRGRISWKIALDARDVYKRQVQADGQLKQDTGQLRVIVVSHGVAGQEGVDAELLGTGSHQPCLLYTSRFSHDYTADALDAVVTDLLTQYAPWAKRAAEWQRISRASLAALQFPFPGYRPGQRAMIGAVYKICTEGGQLLCHCLLYTSQQARGRL